MMIALQTRTPFGLKETAGSTAVRVEKFLSFTMVDVLFTNAQSVVPLEPAADYQTSLDALVEQQGVQEPTDLDAFMAVPREPLEDDFIDLLREHRNSQSAGDK